MSIRHIAHTICRGFDSSRGLPIRSAQIHCSRGVPRRPSLLASGPSYRRADPKSSGPLVLAHASLLIPHTTITEHAHSMSVVEFDQLVIKLGHEFGRRGMDS